MIPAAIARGSVRQRPECGLPRRSRRVLVAEGGHSENSGDRKNGDGHPGSLLGRTPSATRQERDTGPSI